MYFGIPEKDTIKQTVMEKKSEKNTIDKRENFSKINSEVDISSKR